MACFDMDTGIIGVPCALYTFSMRDGLTPYYARDGRYVGCKCHTPHMSPDTDFYNPASDYFIEFYEELDW